MPNFRSLPIAIALFIMIAAHARAADPPQPAPGPSENLPTPNYTPPETHRLNFNFDQDWKFSKQNTPNAEKPTLDDSAWANVSLPHTFNDIDTFREKAHGQKEERQFEGTVWYRKHFTLDPAWSDRKVFLEFEGIRNTAIFYINGKQIGEHSNQVGPCGLDITSEVKFGQDNLLAVSVDNHMLDKDPKGFSYSWSAQAFYPNFGGLFKDATLHLTDPLYQTLPLYSNLKTQGVYLHTDNLDTANRTAQFTAESEVANDSPTPQTATLEAWIVDHDGKTILKQSATPQTILPNKKTILTLTAPMTDIHFWSPDYPYLYRAFTALSVNGKIIDLVENPLGVRKLTFSAAAGLKINGHPIYLKGFAPRTMMEWAVAGIPQDWMTEYDYKLMKECHANFIRPMHVAPRKNQVESADKFGILMTCPAGDAEGDDHTDAEGNARWQDRLEVMRDVMIYYRNNPSIVFYEASNSQVSHPHMADMIRVREQWDPHGGRFVGTRSTDEKTTDIREYQSPMDVPHTSAEMPSWDAEYARAECPRRIWDKITPFLDANGKPITGGLIKVATPEHSNGGGNGIFDYPQDAFRLNTSEDLALNLTLKYFDRYKTSALFAPPDQRAAKGIMVGGAKIFFADSNSDGRLRDMEVARCTGTVDAVRLTKESYFALQVAQNPAPQVYILGHWNYPANTIKTVYVIANTDKVKLLTHDSSGALLKDYGFGVREVVAKDRTNQYAFKFKDIAWQPGKIEAIGYNADKEVARFSKSTAGPPVALKLTPVPSPGNWRADGADIALIDVEAVDANGNRCPTVETRVDFTPSGNAIFMGGYNSGIKYSTFQNHLNIEAGINRVLVRASRTPGPFTLTATSAGLKPDTLTLTSAPFENKNGLSTETPRRYSYILGPEPAFLPDDAPLLASRANKSPPPARPKDTTSIIREFNYTGTHGDTLDPPLPLAHIEHNLKNGDPIYVDENWKFEKLPDYLVGGDYVQAFQRDATESSSTDTIQFFTNKKCNLYLLVDSANAMPNHNDNKQYAWTRQKESITINGRKLDIYKSTDLPEDFNGYLAANGKDITLAKNSLQYIVIAVPTK